MQVEVEQKGDTLRTLYGNESLAMMMSTPGLIRNVALAGHLHHGKTLVRQFYVACMQYVELPSNRGHEAQNFRLQHAAHAVQQ